MADITSSWRYPCRIPPSVRSDCPNCLPWWHARQYTIVVKCAQLGVRVIDNLTGSGNNWARRRGSVFPSSQRTRSIERKGSSRVHAPNRKLLRCFDPFLLSLHYTSFHCTMIASGMDRRSVKNCDTLHSRDRLVINPIKIENRVAIQYRGLHRSKARVCSLLCPCARYHFPVLNRNEIRD
jgi:hypothetical protein